MKTMCVFLYRNVCSQKSHKYCTMRIIDIINEKAPIGIEKKLYHANDYEVIFSTLQDLGLNPEKTNGNKIKVAVPEAERKETAEFISQNFPESELIRNGKDVAIGTVTVEIKPAGGRGGGGRNFETSQVEMIDELIKGLCKKENKTEITLKVGKNLVKAAGVVKQTEGIKADIAVVDASGIEQAWISLKKGPSPKDVAGWGGITHLANNPEVSDFANIAIMLFGKEGIPPGRSFGKEIKNTSSGNLLKNQVVFGKEFGGNYGPSNVNLVLQGVPDIKHKNNHYVLSSDTNIWANGDTPTGPYEPILIVGYRPDRNNFGIPFARFATFPKDARPYEPIEGRKEKPKKNAKPMVEPTAPVQQYQPPAQEIPPEDTTLNQIPPDDEEENTAVMEKFNQKYWVK